MKRPLFYLVLVAIVVFAVEAGAFAALALLRARHYAYEVPRETQPLDYATRKRIGDPILGWPLTEGKDAPGGAYRDVSGARRLPAYADPATPSCVSLYGDSFMESVELDHEHAAANLLARSLSCRVANFGQAGYGTDQALMRYQRNAADSAGIVVLGHMLENIRRNINRNRDALSGGRDYNLKPRFVLDPDGKLVFVPMLDLSEEQYERSVGLRLPLLPLEHESFQPGGDLIGPMASFPYSVALLRNLDNYGLQSRVRGYHSSFAVLYRREHPARALELTVAIMRAFVAEAAKRGQRSVVLLMPTLEDLTYHEKTSAWVHGTLVEQLEREGIPYMDFAPYLAAHRDRDFGAYFTASGHYNERGDALLASLMAEKLPPRSRR